MLKKILLSVSFIFFIGVVAFAQASQAETIAQKIAQKMKDSLSLSDLQKKQVYQINLQLHNQKAAFRQQYSDMETLSAQFQKVENTRDSIYRGVLSAQQFILYQQKKRNLINNN